MRAGADRADFCHFQRAEFARESDLEVIGDVLTAKHEERVLFERGAHRVISGLVVRHVGERHTA